MSVGTFTPPSGVNYGSGSSGFSGMFHPATGVIIDQPVPTAPDIINFYANMIREIQALIRDNPSQHGFGRPYTCDAGLTVGSPVKFSAANTVALATATSEVNSFIVGFVAYKPTTTTCYIKQNYYMTGLSGLTAGQPVYLSNAGGFSTSAGTYPRQAGIALSTTEALLGGGVGAGGALSGMSGTSGFSGTFSGWSGTSGASGTSGFSGTFSGWSGQSGLSGQSGQSGFSGQQGTSGYSGIGASGFSGVSGFSSQSGQSGSSGRSGYSGQQGIQGIQGESGFSGQSGRSGYSGVSAFSGVSGYSGTSGFSGTYSGFSGTSGYSGAEGQQGLSGFSGAPGSGGGSVDGTGSATQIAIWSDEDTLTGSTSLNWEEGDAKLIIAGNCQLSDLTATTVYASTVQTLGSGSDTADLNINSGPSGESSGDVVIDAGTYVTNPGQVKIGVSNADTIELSSGGPYGAKYVHVASELHSPYITGHYGNMYIDARGPETGAGYDCNISAGNGSSGEAGGSVIITAGNGSPNGVVQVYKKLLCWGDSNANAPFQILPASGTPSDMSEGAIWIDSSASAGQQLRIYVGGVAYYVNLTAV